MYSQRSNETTSDNDQIPGPSEDYTPEELELFNTLKNILSHRETPFFSECPNTTITMVNCGETYSAIASLYKIADKGEHYKHENYLKTSDIFGDCVYDVERYSFDNMSLTIDDVVPDDNPYKHVNTILVAINNSSQIGPLNGCRDRNANIDQPITACVNDLSNDPLLENVLTFNTVEVKTMTINGEKLYGIFSNTLINGIIYPIYLSISQSSTRPDLFILVWRIGEANPLLQYVWDIERTKYDNTSYVATNLKYTGLIPGKHKFARYAPLYFNIDLSNNDSLFSSFIVDIDNSHSDQGNNPGVVLFIQ